MPDDMQFLWPESPNGPDASIDTPHLNSIRADGTTFTQSYTNGPKCAPARFGLLTSRYCSKATFAQAARGTTSLRTSISVPTCKINGVEDEAKTVPQLFKAAGYRTIMSGKYHLLNGGRWDDYEGTRDLIMKAGWTDDGGVYMSNMDNSQGLSFSHNLEWNVNRSLAAIDAARDADQAFFLYFAATVPHGPAIDAALALDPLETPAGRLSEMPEDGMPARSDVIARATNRRGRYQDKTAGTLWYDDAVGAILRHVDQLGATGNTIVVSLMDHGVAAKDELYEGGVRIMHSMKYPGVVPAGELSNAVVTSLDIGPTLLEACGLSSTYSMDGASYFGLFVGGGFAPAPAIVSEIETDRAVVAGGFKFISSFSGNTKDGYPASGQPEQLYDLAADPGEQVNLVDEEAHASVLLQLKAFLACHDQDTLPNALAGSIGCNIRSMHALQA